jgi:hypothetical protein
LSQFAMCWKYRMRDRQYVSSLVISAAAAAGTLTGIVLFLLWVNWGGVVGLLTLVVVILAWFYWGPRPEGKQKGRGVGIKGPASE